MVTMENYEEYMMLAADGELDNAGEIALQAFLADHPQLLGEYNMYMATRIQPDAAQVYTQKQDLLKPEVATHRISLSGWWTYGAAASVAVLIAVWLLRPGHEQQPVVVAHAPVTTPAHKEHVQQPATTVHSAPVKAVIQESADYQDPSPKGSIARHQKKKVMPVKAEQHLQQPDQPETVLIAALPDKQQQPLPASIKPISPESITTPIVVVPQMHEGKENNVLLALLNEDGREGINEFKGVISEKIEKAKNIKDKIKGTDIAVSVRNKELFVLKF